MSTPDERARPDHHDPTRGIGGAPPARSALTLRLVLAGFGLVACAVAAVLLAGADAPVAVVVVFAVLAVVALVDLVVVVRRKLRGEPG
jgi:membrane protein implicated in regulation of membrane protease activity